MRKKHSQTLNIVLRLNSIECGYTLLFKELQVGEVVI